MEGDQPHGGYSESRRCNQPEDLTQASDRSSVLLFESAVKLWSGPFPRNRKCLPAVLFVLSRRDVLTAQKSGGRANVSVRPKGRNK